MKQFSKIILLLLSFCVLKPAKADDSQPILPAGDATAENDREWVSPSWFTDLSEDAQLENYHSGITHEVKDSFDADLDSAMRELQEKQNEFSQVGDQSSYLQDDLMQQLLEDCPERIKVLIGRFIRARSASVRTRSMLTTDKLLLVGPPGVGKSDMAKAIAQAIGRPFIFLQSSLLATEYQNSGAQNLKRVITEIKESGQPYVVILDEIHCLIDKNKNEKRADQDTAVALWQLIDDCSQSKNILFIGTTNSLKNIPDALISRFVNSIVEIGLPKLPLREKIILFYSADIIDLALIKQMAHKTQGFSARELKEITREMIACATLRNAQADFSDFQTALQEIVRTRKLFQTSWRDAIIDYSKQNALSIAGLGISVGSLSMQLLSYLRHEITPIDRSMHQLKSMTSMPEVPAAQRI